MINYSYRSSGWRDILTNVGGVSYSSDAIGTQDYYYIRNAQGDIAGIADAAGNPVVAYSYDAWGRLLDTAGTLASTIGAYNPLRNRGYVYDGETGYYYLQSRYYDPANGRFLNADVYVSTGQAFIVNNMFVYCNNEPVNDGDPEGNKPVQTSNTLMTDSGSCYKVNYSAYLLREYQKENSNIKICEKDISANGSVGKDGIWGEAHASASHSEYT